MHETTAAKWGKLFISVSKTDPWDGDEKWFKAYRETTRISRIYYIIAVKTIIDSGLRIENRSTSDLTADIADAKTAIDLFLNNKFNEAKKIFEPGMGRNIYHTIGHAILTFMDAVLSLEKESITKASEELKGAISLCDLYRKKTSFSDTIEKIVKKSKYVELTPAEMHAELCYAEALILKAILTFVEGDSVVNFIKAGFRIRGSLKRYKECRIILNAGRMPSEEHFVHFQSGVCLGTGGFNLVISLLPTRIVQLLEFIGFSGDKELGLNELLTSYRLEDGLRSVLAIMALLIYNLVFTPAMSHQEGDLDLCTEILTGQLQLYPKGSIFLYFKGRLEFVKGNIPEAIRWYTSSWHSQTVYPQFHHICFWDLIWIHSLLLDWNGAHEYASILLRENKWSRTIYGYVKMSQLLMKASLTNSDEQDIKNLLVNIPMWKQKFSGRSIPMEKFCAERCRRYSNQRNHLVLPVVELLYLMNYFKIMGKKWDKCQSFYKLVSKAAKDYEKEQFQGSPYEYDNKCLLLLLKGACLFRMKNISQAEVCLTSILEHEKKLKEDLFIVPYSQFELALIYDSQGRTQQAIQTLENVKKNYSDYSLESSLHFRIHLALLDFNSKK